MHQPFSTLALLAIRGYQNLLSHYKGYACAHRVHYGGTGCSGYAKHRIQEVGLWVALPDIRARFTQCASAADALYAQAHDGAKRPSRKERRRLRRAESGRSDYSWCAVDGCGDVLLCAKALPNKSRGSASSGDGCDGDCTPGDCGPS